MNENILERARKLSVLCAVAIVLLAILYLLPPFISSVLGIAFSWIFAPSLSGIIVVLFLLLFLIFIIASSIWFFGALRSGNLSEFALFILCLAMPWFVIIVLIRAAIEFFRAYREAKNSP